MPPHCDSMDGPVVLAAKRALDAHEPKLALPYVKADGESEVLTARVSEQRPGLHAVAAYSYQEVRKMTPEPDSGRRPPRERFAGTEHVFDLARIAEGLRDESYPVHDGHRQMAILRKGSLALIVFDFEAGGRLADHVADAYVTIMALSGELEVSTSSGTHQVPAGSLLVLDPGVLHDVLSAEPSQMLLVVDRLGDDTSAP
jgi:quercetin dioxygenase-like cupin family protein